MPPDLQFSAVAHYLCDPTQTPNSRSRIAALLHLFNLSAISFPVKLNELAGLVDKLLGKFTNSSDVSISPVIFFGMLQF